jgi:hypothetical protein
MMDSCADLSGRGSRESVQARLVQTRLTIEEDDAVHLFSLSYQ